MLQSEKWRIRYLNLARLVSTWSKDPSTKCGAVIVNPDNKIVGTGFNGFPHGVNDNEDLLENRDTKLMMTVHAEVNAILSAKQPLDGCTIYTWPMHACSQCAAIIIQSGIRHHVTLSNPNNRWEASHKIAEVMFNEAKVDVHLYDLQSLKVENETE